MEILEGASAATASEEVLRAALGAEISRPGVALFRIGDWSLALAGCSLLWALSPAEDGEPRMSFARIRDECALIHIGLGAARRPDVVCPDCGDPVIARRGEQRRHHFAHAPKADHERKACRSEGETQLHLFAKACLAPGSPLSLPPIVGAFKGLRCADTGLVAQGRPIVLSRPDVALIATIEKAEHEVALGPLRTDVMAAISPGEGWRAHPDDLLQGKDGEMMEIVAARSTEASLIGGRLAIEIFVSNPLGADRRRAARDTGVAMIEIDLIGLKPSAFATAEALARHIQLRAPRRWISAPALGAAIAEEHARAEEALAERRSKLCETATARAAIFELNIETSPKQAQKLDAVGLAAHDLGADSVRKADPALGIVLGASANSARAMLVQRLCDATSGKQRQLTWRAVDEALADASTRAPADDGRSSAPVNHHAAERLLCLSHVEVAALRRAISADEAAKARFAQAGIDLDAFDPDAIVEKALREMGRIFSIRNTITQMRDDAARLDDYGHAPEPAWSKATAVEIIEDPLALLARLRAVISYFLKAAREGASVWIEGRRATQGDDIVRAFMVEGAVKLRLDAGEAIMRARRRAFEKEDFLRSDRLVGARVDISFGPKTAASDGVVAKAAKRLTEWRAGRLGQTIRECETVVAKALETARAAGFHEKAKILPSAPTSAARVPAADMSNVTAMSAIREQIMLRHQAARKLLMAAQQEVVRVNAVRKSLEDQHKEVIGVLQGCLAGMKDAPEIWSDEALCVVRGVIDAATGGDQCFLSASRDDVIAKNDRLRSSLQRFQKLRCRINSIHEYLKTDKGSELVRSAAWRAYPEMRFAFLRQAALDEVNELVEANSSSAHIRLSFDEAIEKDLVVCARIIALAQTWDVSAMLRDLEERGELDRLFEIDLVVTKTQRNKMLYLITDPSERQMRVFIEKKARSQASPAITEIIRRIERIT